MSELQSIIVDASIGVTIGVFLLVALVLYAVAREGGDR